MRMRSALLVAFSACWGLCTEARTLRPETSKEKKPHIIVILVDDAGFADVGFNDGYAPTLPSPTPTLDRLNEEGVSVKRFYVQSTCTPTRVSMMTGQYAWRHALTEFVAFGTGDTDCLGRVLDVQASAASLAQGGGPKYIELKESATLGNPKHKILPERLGEAGYKTHHIGKWHLGMTDTECYPQSRGFDSSFGLLGGFHDHYSHQTATACIATSPNIPCRFDRGFQTTDGYDFHDTREDDNIYRLEEEPGSQTYSTNIYARRTVEIIQDHEPQDDPLFMYIALTAPHNPIQAAVQDLDHPACAPYFSTFPPNPRQYICAMMRGIDRFVESVEQTLKSKGMWDDTVLLFTSDNGGVKDFARIIPFGQNNDPLRGGKIDLYEGGIRVPLFMAGGGVPSNTVVADEAFVDVTDIVPTLLGAAGIPADPTAEFDGRDLSGVLGLKGSSANNIDGKEIKHLPHRDLIVQPRRDTEVQNQLLGVDWDFTTALAIGEYRGGLYKYVITPDRTSMGEIRTTPPELYAIVDDPSEENNLAESLPEAVRFFERILSKYEDETPASYKTFPRAFPNTPFPPNDPKALVFAIPPNQQGCWLALNDPNRGTSDCTGQLKDRIQLPVDSPFPEAAFGVITQCVEGRNVQFPPLPFVDCTDEG